MLEKKCKKLNFQPKISTSSQKQEKKIKLGGQQKLPPSEVTQLKLNHCREKAVMCRQQAQVYIHNAKETLLA